MIVIGEAPLGRGCALACALCSSASPAAASAAAVRRTLRRSISLSSAVGWLTISPSIAGSSIRRCEHDSPPAPGWGGFLDRGPKPSFNRYELRAWLQCARVWLNLERQGAMLAGGARK